jgi:arylsulfatase A-like enzyme
VIPGGRTVDIAAWVADLLPTFLDFAGLPLPADRPLDGVSLRPLLLGEGERPATDFHFGTDKITAIRSGDWKLVLPAQPRFIRFGGAVPMLFYLRDDPGEQTDLAAKYPDRAAGLQARLAAFETAAAAEASRRLARSTAPANESE